ncbi:hypothetical protein ACNKHO_01285 [Shigella flexneri]
MSVGHGALEMTCSPASHGCPSAYRMKPFTFWLAKRLVKTQHVFTAESAGGSRTGERVAGRMNASQRVAGQALKPLLANDSHTSHAMHDTFRELHLQLPRTRMSRRQMRCWELAQ